MLLPALRQDPNNEAALYLYSYAARKRETAVKCCQKILKLNPDNLPAQQRLAKLQPPAGNKPLLRCPLCNLPFKTGPGLAQHLASRHASYSAAPAKAAPVIPAGLETPPRPAGDISPQSAGFPWGTVLFGLSAVALIAGGVLLLPEIIAFLQPVLEAAVFVFFFPLAFPLTMILVGGISAIVAPFMVWMVHVGLFLLTQKWWWFPGGWIAGAIAALFVM